MTARIPEGGDAAAVVKLLEQAPLALATAMLTPPQGVPNRGGFYAWWARRGALPDVPERSHKSDPAWLLLYVGISPASASSRQALRGRLLGNHINGNTGSSTFRFVLASLLMDELDLHPRQRSKKVILDASENTRLRDWQFAHLALTWCERERPWEIEHSVIKSMQPPLNSAGNRSHPFYETVRASRSAFRTAASPEE
jgi:hypothetical protein